jgi:SPP1 family phage portal protein
MADGNEKDVEYYDIYFNEMLYTYKVEYGTKPLLVKSQSRGMWKPLPLVEKNRDSDRIGLVSMGRSMQDAVDNLVSNGLDNIQDIVNQIIVYKNCNLGESESEQSNSHRSGMRNGCIVLNSASKDFPADVDTLKTELSLKEVRELYSIINENFHATLGVPMAMSSTNSGGTTKSGSEVANGYDNAYNHALNDVNSFLEADQELLEKMLWICKNTKGNKINNLEASEIEIKYSLNLTDNILTKTQSYVNLTQTGVPPTIALRICKLSNDPEAEGKIIEDSIEEKAQKALAQAQAQNAQQPNNNSQE